MATNGSVATNPIKAIEISICLSLNTYGLVLREDLTTL